jgi:hypothetical protein
MYNLSLVPVLYGLTTTEASYECKFKDAVANYELSTVTEYVKTQQPTYWQSKKGK